MRDKRRKEGKRGDEVMNEEMRTSSKHMEIRRQIHVKRRRRRRLRYKVGEKKKVG